MVPSQLAVPTSWALLPRGIWAQLALPFEIPVNFLPLAAGATVQVDTQIPAESDFLFTGISGTVTTTDNLTLVPFYPALLQIFEAGATRGFQTGPMHLHNVAGVSNAAISGGALPFVWGVPYLVNRGTTLTSVLASLDPANNRNVRLQFHGVKLFGDRPPDREMVARETATAESALQTLANIIRGG